VSDSSEAETEHDPAGTPPADDTRTDGTPASDERKDGNL
jgi:hypothetical protein